MLHIQQEATWKLTNLDPEEQMHMWGKQELATPRYSWDCKPCCRVDELLSKWREPWRYQNKVDAVVEVTNLSFRDPIPNCSFSCHCYLLAASLQPLVPRKCKENTVAPAQQASDKSQNHKQLSIASTDEIRMNAAEISENTILHRLKVLLRIIKCQQNGWYLTEISKIEAQRRFEHYKG